MTSGGVETDLEAWYGLGYFNYEIIHNLKVTRKKWQYHLFKMVKSYFYYSVAQEGLMRSIKK